MSFSMETKYDTELKKVDHFSRYPEMIPFVGCDYGRHLQKMLVIGESHYCPKWSDAYSIDTWYTKTAKLKPDELHWIDTRKCLQPNEDGKWEQPTYRNLTAALKEAGLDVRKNMFEHVAYMNCFLRPAANAKSIEADHEDDKRSIATLKEVLRILQPRAVCFVSAKAWNRVGSKLLCNGRDVEHTYHPSQRSWHRPSQRGTAKELFVQFVREHIL